MDAEKNLLFEILRNEKILNCLQYHCESPISRNDTKIADSSEEIRNKGNQLYLQKNHDAETHIEIFRYYCQSISLAPLGSELLAKAYANRSAFLLHINKCEECILDVDRALEITKSDLLTIKLLCRKVDCMKKLALPNYQSVLENVENLASKIDEKNKTQIDELINKVKRRSVSNRKVPKKQSNQNMDLSSQKNQLFNCVSIEHNEKYGRHLIAKKDYNPGDFIFREKLYATVLNENLNYTNCDYCLKICWSGIACDYCSWAMFCSKECRKKAWDTFHDVECSVESHQIYLAYFNVMKFALRTLLVGIREIGSIDKLREELKLIDQSTNDCCKAFYKSDQFVTSIQTIYSLKSRDISKIDSEKLPLDALITLINIVKYGELIKNVKLEKIDDILANEDLIFLVSLLIRLSLISMNNNFLLCQMICDCQRLKRADSKCCDRGSCLSVLSSLLNHSCNPNVIGTFTEDQHINIFALKPIKKDSQIFITYAGFYYNKSLEDRKNTLGKYSFTCDCEACIESWSPLFRLPNYFDLIEMQSVFEKKLYNDCKNIFNALDVKKIDFNKKDVKKLCKTIVEANKHLIGPTILIATLEDSLIRIYSRMYGWKSPIHVFGNCKKMQVTANK